MATRRVAPRDSYRQQWRYVAQLWRDPELFGIEKVVLLAVTLGRFALPSMHLNMVAGRLPFPSNKRVIDLYVMLKPLVLVQLLRMGHGGDTWLAVLAVYLLVDVYQYLIGAVLLSRPNLFAKPVSSGRSLILAFVNYVEITISFAILYLSAEAVCQSSGMQALHAVNQWQTAVYFSMITSATVGYGDFVPCGSWGHTIALVQTFSSLVFGASVLTVLVSRVAPPHGPEQDKLPGGTGQDREEQ